MAPGQFEETVGCDVETVLCLEIPRSETRQWLCMNDNFSPYGRSREDRLLPKSGHGGDGQPRNVNISKPADDDLPTKAEDFSKQLWR